MLQQRGSLGQDQAVELAHLRLLHLADSALPIGGLAHSFGLETLTARVLLDVPDVEGFLRDYLEEAGSLEAVFCREGFRLGITGKFRARRWLEINERLSALKAGRESRAASAALGRNFLNAVFAVSGAEVANRALQAASEANIAVHHSPAFGLAAGALGVEENSAVLACLHQLTAGLVSACQRLLPLGQTRATAILWNLKPAILQAAHRSQDTAAEEACCFLPLLDWAAMEHVALHTRLFIS